MSTFAGSYVPIGQSSDPRINYIIDQLLTPKILAFRQVTVYDEVAVLQTDNLTWRVSYANWNPTFPLVVRKNKAKLQDSDILNINPILGTLEIGPVIIGDNCNITYNFSYFDIGMLTGYILQGVDTINTSTSFGSSTEYTIDTAPQNWDSVLADLAFISCMEKLIFDHNIWKGRLIFAIGQQQWHEGQDDIVGTLEGLKSTAQDRVNKSLESERFKLPNSIARPTQYYYQAIRGGGMSGGAHNEQFYGKARGMKINKYI